MQNQVQTSGDIELKEVPRLPLLPLEMSSIPVLRDEIEFKVLDDFSSVAVDPESGQAHALTPVATAIIERCDGELSVSGIIAEIVDIFDCRHEQAATDVPAFLEDLASRDLVRW